MSEHPIQGLMSTTMQKIREMVDVNTVIGDPIPSPDGGVIIPVSRVSFGFASGGSDLPTKQPKDMFGGASGAGISIQPIAFLVVHGGDVQLLQMATGDNVANNIVNLVPEVIDKIHDIFQQNKKNKQQSLEQDPAPKTSDLNAQ